MKTVRIAATMLLGLLGLLALVGVGVTVFVATFDANAYRQQIGSFVERTTGRRLDITGELNLKVWPDIAIKAADLSLANNPEFGDQAMLRVDHAELHIKLMPLLDGDIQIDAIVLRKPRLNLVTNPNGTNNWQDVLERFSSQDSAGITPALQISQVRLVDADLRHVNSGTLYSLSELNAEVDLLETNRAGLRGDGVLTTGSDPVEIDFSAELDFADPNVRITAARLKYSGMQTPMVSSGELAFREAVVSEEGMRLVDVNFVGELADEQILPISAQASAVELSENYTHIEFSNLTTQVDATTATWDLDIEGIDSAPVAKGSLVVSGAEVAPLLALVDIELPSGVSAASLGNIDLEVNFHYHSVNGELRLSNTKLTALGLSATLSGSGNLGTNNQPAEWRGTAAIAAFSLRHLLKKLDIELTTANAKAFDQVSLKSNIELDDSAIAFTSLRAKIDSSSLTGNFGLEFSNPPELSFALEFDKLNANDYLIPDESVGEVTLPTDLLQDQNLRGSIKLGDLEWSGLQLSDTRASVTIGNGIGTINPLRTKFYGGAFAGNLKLVAPGTDKPSELSMRGSITQVDIAELLTALAGTANLTGKADLELDLEGTGETLLATTRSANGSFKISVGAGSFTGVNMGHKLCDIFNRIRSLPAPATTDKQSTPFDSFNATAVVSNGVAHTSDLVANNAYLKMTGTGDAHLAQQSIDYDLNIVLVGPIEIANCEKISEYVGSQIPVKLTGTFAEPVVRPDFGKLVVQQIRRKIEEEIADKLFDLFGGNKDKKKSD